jgi:hypothetical protein
MPGLLLPLWVMRQDSCVQCLKDLVTSWKKKKERGYTVCSSGYAATDTS